jgi:hypothetical protein
VLPMKATAEQPYPQTFEQFLEWFPTEEDCTAGAIPNCVPTLA